MNNFKNKYKVSQKILKNPINIEKDKINQVHKKLDSIRDAYSEKEAEHYNQLHNNDDYKEYFHHIIAAIMLSQNERYEDFTLEAPYRFKAPISINKKIEEYAKNTAVDFNKNTKTTSIKSKPLLDAFACKFVLTNRPSVLFSSDPEISKLIDEERKNNELLASMQQFKSRIIEDEFTTPKKYKYECTKIEYYQNCKKMLERIQELLAPEAINLIEKYDKQIIDIDNCLNYLYASHDEDLLIDEKDLKNSKMNFFTILKDYTSRIPDKLDLEILTKQIKSLFSNNEIFEKLGISLDDKVKTKRTKDGYISNFIYMNTPFGKVECQLQSEHEYQEGNYGYAAHTKLTGKSIRPLPLPDKDNENEIKGFISDVKLLAPKSFLARMDSTEQNRVMVQEFSDYQNYKNLVSQVAKNDPCEPYLLNYFSKLYATKDQIFKTREKSLGFVDHDISNYLKSDKLQKIINLEENTSLKDKKLKNEQESHEER